jgi:endonuclease III
VSRSAAPRTDPRESAGAAARPPVARVPWARIVSAMSSALATRFPDKPIPSVSRIARRRHDPFRVLVSTMISLRTKDEVTAPASERLLAAAPTAARLAGMGEARIARLIYPAGFYRTKARALRAAARLLVDSHGGRVPHTMEELLALPGVGRKTANLVRNLGFGLDGICVDTHVHRIANRLGWVRTRDAGQTESALMRVLPRRYWIPINELLVRWGQSVCTPLSPWCSTCEAARWCRRTGVGRAR